MIKATLFNSTLATSVAFGVTVITLCLVQSAWLARGWLAVASTTVRVPDGLSTQSVRATLVQDIHV